VKVEIYGRSDDLIEIRVDGKGRVEIWGRFDDLIYLRIDGKDRDEIDGHGRDDGKDRDEIDGHGRDDGKDRDEIGGHDSVDDQHSRALEVRSIGGARGIRVHAIYDGCWSFAAGQLAKDRAIPAEWSVRVEQEHGYSTRLVIETGDELVQVTREGGKPLDDGEGDES